MPTFENYKLGEQGERLLLDSLSDSRSAVVTLLAQTRSRVALYSRTLDPRIYNTMQVDEAVRKLILGGGRAQVRILVTQPQTVVRGGHCLCRLASRFSSFIELRRAPEFCVNHQENFIVLDDAGYYYRDTDIRFESVLDFNDRYRCRELLNVFNAWWEEASVDADLHSWQL